MLAVAAFLITLLLGAVGGVLAEHAIGPRLRRIRDRRQTLRLQRSRQYRGFGGRRLIIDGVDFGVHVLAGALGHSHGRRAVGCVLSEERWRAPDHLRRRAERHAADRGYYDGDVARLDSLHVSVHEDERGVEHHSLSLHLRPTGFFDFLATNVALGPFTSSSAPLLDGRDGLGATPLSGMVGLDLTLVTTDGYVPIFRRSRGMAALEDCWQVSSGETLQLRLDCDTSGRPDIFRTALRGLHEELAIEPELIHDLAVTGIVTTPEFANISILTVATVDLAADELDRRFEELVISARDNWEYGTPATVALNDAKAVAEVLTGSNAPWTRCAAASLLFAHSLATGGLVAPLIADIRTRGGLRLTGEPLSRL